MARTLVVYDPYRDTNTTLTEFAKAEGVKRNVVSHYFWYHRSLDGFRDRLPYRAGQRPRIYTHKGIVIDARVASKLLHISQTTMMEYRDKYKTSDIDEIKRLHYADVGKRIHLYETDDGRMVCLSDFAKENGVSYNSVFLWVKRHGSLKGFAKRDYSRLNPKRYPHSGLGVTKTIKEWAEHFGCKKSNVKSWLHKHGKDLKGFKERKQGRPAKNAA